MLEFARDLWYQILQRLKRAQHGESLDRERPRLLGDTFRKFLRNRGASIGAAILVGFVVVAVAAPLISPYDPLVMYQLRLEPPRWSHPFGTDLYGRDILSRVLFGARPSLAVGIIAALIATLAGSLIGLVSGYSGGRTDSVLMRFMDIMLAFPPILLALVIVALLGEGLFNVMIAVGISSIPQFARLVRGSTLSVSGYDYVEAAISLGCGRSRILFLHILPNVMAPIIVMATLTAASSIVAAASLSFLGLGAQPPTPEWGAMLSEGRNYLRQAWWMMAFPGLALMMASLALNMVGDGLREVWDPRLKS